MKTILVSFEAIEKIASLRQYQSIEFTEGLNIVQFLKDPKSDRQLSELSIEVSGENISIISKSKNTKGKGIIIDLTTFTDLKKFNDSDTLIVFQKIIKYGIRYFNKYPLTNAEKNINTDLAIIFPFSFSYRNDGYKVGIVKTVDQRRNTKRDLDFLYVYQGVYEGQEINIVNIKTNNFRNAIEAYRGIQNDDTQENSNSIIEQSTTDLQAFTLTNELSLTIDSGIGYDNWNHYLTDTQKSFINNISEGSSRLEGPAGTGKTLSLILRCIKQLTFARSEDKRIRILFITHSLATKKQIEIVFSSNCNDFNSFNNNESRQYIKVSTLQEWCIEFLGNNIQTSEYLDKDALESKTYQALLIEDMLTEEMKASYPIFRSSLSSKLVDFFENTEISDIVEMLQHEIGVNIKGKSGEDIESYMKVDRGKHSIPINDQNKYDYQFIFYLFNLYQEKLISVGQYDSDDVILTALGQLDTPIWRRRREDVGFNYTYIDETHLFNFNELSIFHFINTSTCRNNIIFSIDKTQAIGDQGITNDSIGEVLGIGKDENYKSTKLGTMFRCAPEITDFAFSILSNGASLFTTFDNPLENIYPGFTHSEESRSEKPIYKLLLSDDEIIISSFNEAQLYVMNKEQARRHNVLIIATSNELLGQFKEYASNNNKPVEMIKSRGDLETIKNAKERNSFLIGGIDYVGGLEFDFVIIAGVDKGRVPPTSNSSASMSKHFLTYAWHNRMYVAITRARYKLILFGLKSTGQSTLTTSAIDKKIIDFTP